jgi:tRNA A-37 threonylcarbamoyl transferase component Bud32
MTLMGLMVYKGFLTKEQGDALISRMNAGAAPGLVGPPRPTRMLQAPKQGTSTRPITPSPPRPGTRQYSPTAGMPKTLLPDEGDQPARPLPQSFLSGAPGDAPTGGDATLVPDAGETHAGIKSVDPDVIDEEEEVTSTAQAPSAGPVSAVETVIPPDSPPAPSDDRITAKVDSGRSPERPTARRTSNVEDSRPGRTTSKRQTVKSSGVTMWAYEGAQDELAATDKIVAAGTIIQASEVTIAHVRHQMGIGEGVKLVSDKMGSTLAHIQPDAGAEKKRYVVIREIARGGMGKVLEVEDTELRRSVALKVLRKELLGRRDVVERFLEEAQITGQLEHPNLVPVHEMGVDGAGNLYFTMKYVEGLSLSEVLLKLREGNRDTKRDFPLLKLLDAFIKICEGMAFAHNRGVIHRDLKPANIMVGKFGEVQVMDWGVGKVVGKELKRATSSPERTGET